jgi:predicted DNA-binding transcriptional regulator YafY
MPGYRTDLTGLTAAEARALVALSGRAVPEDLGMGTALASAVHKLVAAVPVPHRAAAQQARELVHVDHSSWFRSVPEAPLLEAVQDAVFARRRLQVRYRSGGTAPERRYTVDPVGLVVKTGLWYLIGSHRRQERMWRVDRVTAVTALDEPAHPPQEDLAGVWERLRSGLERPPADPTTVSVRARVDVVDMVLRVTASRRLDADGAQGRVPAPDDDGWVRMTMQFPGDRAAVAALIPFAGDVEILAPESTRARMREVATDAVQRHAVPGQ